MTKQDIQRARALLQARADWLATRLHIAEQKKRKANKDRNSEAPSDAARFTVKVSHGRTR